MDATAAMNKNSLSPNLDGRRGLAHVQAVANQVRELRARAGLSRVDVAALSGTAVSTVALIEQGGCPQHSKALGRIVEAINRELEGQAAAAANGSDPDPEGGE